jgi:hypothetical protein
VIRAMTTIPAPALEHVFDARILDHVAGMELGQPVARDGLVIGPAGHHPAGEAGPRDDAYVENTGLRFGPPEALERLRRGEPVDPALIYFRSAPRCGGGPIRRGRGGAARGVSRHATR